jgi:hypothetical protein
MSPSHVPLPRPILAAIALLVAVGVAGAAGAQLVPFGPPIRLDDGATTSSAASGADPECDTLAVTAAGTVAALWPVETPQGGFVAAARHATERGGPVEAGPVGLGDADLLVPQGEGGFLAVGRTGARRFDADATPGPFSPYGRAVGRVSAAPRGPGGAAIAYAAVDEATHLTTVDAAYLDASGAIVGAPFHVAVGKDGVSVWPLALTAIGEDRFALLFYRIVPWDGGTPRPNVLALRLFGDGGAFVGDPITLGPLGGSTFLGGGHGRFAVAWVSSRGFVGVRARIFDADGHAGPTLQLGRPLRRPQPTAVAVSPEGATVLVTWSEAGRSRGQRFDASSRPLGAAFSAPAAPPSRGGPILASRCSSVVATSATRWWFLGRDTTGRFVQLFGPDAP